MERKMKRTISLLMAFVMVALSMLTCSPANAEEEANSDFTIETTDFVLVLDGSATMSANDREGMCLAACKQFIDQLPVQDVRVSVIVFGDTVGAAYQYSEKYGIQASQNLVHELVPMGSINAKAYKNKIDECKNRNGQYTPIGQALVAAVDTLEKSGSTKGNACVILMSDGIVTDPTSHEDSSGVYTDRAIATAKGNEWPIYCIELPKTGEYQKDAPKANKYMNRISVESGAGESGHIMTKELSEVAAAFNKIFARFWDGTEEVYTVAANAEHEFVIPDLTSESNLVVNGKTLSKVKLTYVHDNVTYDISEEMDEKRIVSAVEKGHYIAIKLICPPSGQWKLVAEGDPNATMVVFHNSLQERALKMTAAASTEGVLTKKDSISVQAVFTYRGIDDTNNKFYEQYPASLIVRNLEKDITREFEMTGDANGYFIDFDVSKIPSGNFDMQVQLKHSMFRSGIKKSNVASFTSENKMLELVKDSTTELQQFVGKDFERIDLNSIFNNPDGDPIDYTINCASDRSMKFDSTFDMENGYLTIAAGMVPGTFDMVLGAKDPDMAEELTHNIKLTVEDRSMVISEIPAIELWSDYFSWQGEPMTSKVLDLKEYVTDPDELPITFKMGEISHEGIVELTHDKGSLTMEANEGVEGNVSLIIVVNDSISDEELRVDVSVISGKSLWWSENWIYFLIAGIAFLIFIFVMIGASKLTRVKGIWNIRVAEGYDTLDLFTYDIRHNWRVARENKQFLLKDLITFAAPFMEPNGVGANAIEQHINDYFDAAVVGEGAKISLKGVLTGKGCTVTGLPKKTVTGGSVTVSYKGLPKTKAFKYRGGGQLEFKFEITDNTFGQNKVLTVTMDLT